MKGPLDAIMYGASWRVTDAVGRRRELYGPWLWLTSSRQRVDFPRPEFAAVRRRLRARASPVLSTVVLMVGVGLIAYATLGVVRLPFAGDATRWLAAGVGLPLLIIVGLHLLIAVPALQRALAVAVPALSGFRYTLDALEILFFGGDTWRLVFYSFLGLIFIVGFIGAWRMRAGLQPDLFRSAMLKRGRCPQCSYPIERCQPDPADACRVCPECGAAWKLPETPPIAPEPVKGTP